MATLQDIRRVKYPHLAISMSGDDYASIVWLAPDGSPWTGSVPTEVEMRAFSDEVDLQLAREEMIVSPRQFRLALLGAGLYASFKAMVAAADEATQITVEYAVRFERLSPLVDVFAAQAGMSAAQVDAIFEAAGAIGD